MNKELFCQVMERFGDTVEGLAEALDLSTQDVLDLIDDSGFYGPDARTIKDRYRLTYKELCKIFLDVD